MYMYDVLIDLVIFFFIDLEKILYTVTAFGSKKITFIILYYNNFMIQFQVIDIVMKIEYN